MLILTFISFFVLSNSVEIDYSGIVNNCFKYLQEHECKGVKWHKQYHFYRPSIEKYSADQWLWDSGSHMIVWSNKNVTNSVLDMRTMLQFQQKDGRIPEEIFWSERSVKENMEILLQYSNTQFTDTTQMPVLPYSLRAIYTALQKEDKGKLMKKSKEILTEFVYPLVDYFIWWRNTRDLGDGLIVAIHNWETGLDASPAYDPAFHVYITEVNETSKSELYPKFIELVESYKLIYRWNTSAIVHRNESFSKFPHVDNFFIMKDLAMNSVYASGWEVLSRLLLELNDNTLAEYCYNQFLLSSTAILNKMWDDEKKQFHSLFIDSDGIEKPSIANTVQNLFPILLSNLPAEKMSVIVDQLQDKSKFNSIYSIPTVAMDDPQFCATFDADLMWRGPIWGFTNWFIMEGLGLHKQFNTQKMIFDNWITLVEKSGIYEHYNPLTAEPYGPEGLGMSTLICDWIYRYGLDNNSS
eukprot:gene10682-14345_t